jgi:NitT/TauT family transport system substrate-binding protein
MTRRDGKAVVALLVIAPPAVIEPEPNADRRYCLRNALGNTQELLVGTARMHANGALRARRQRGRLLHSTERRMRTRIGFALLVAVVACAFPHALAADTLKIASPIRGSWEGAIPELGQQAGIFRKHGLDLDILYTQGGGETLQVVVSGAVDVGLSAGVLGSFGAYAKGAPIRIIGASSTGSREVFWWVAASRSSLTSMREVNGQTIAYSTTGASSHINVLRFISEYGLRARPVATGDTAATITQVMSGQVDVGWAVAPFVLDLLDKGEARMIARASDLPAVRGQTIRAQITNAQILAAKKDAIARYMKAYNETVDWMYASAEAVPRYLAFSGLSESAVRLMLKDFIPKESLQTEKIFGLEESMKDAVQFKFLPAPLNEGQLKELIQIAPGT